VSRKLIDLVEFLFSKNAGPYVITFDAVFKDDAAFDLVRGSGVINRATLARIFNVPEGRILSIHDYPAGRVIKFNIVRDISSGDFGDRSVFGSQLWAPLISLEIPATSAERAIK
jgi:hypothetical protein